MRYALIIAGGSGTRLWPMSRSHQPKQLIPFIKGKSLLQISRDRLDGLVPSSNVYICAGQSHKQAILENLEGLSEEQYIAEPTGRDTLNAVGLAATVIAQRDPEAVIAVFTADHIIEPVDLFQKCVTQGYDLAESTQPTLVTFGIRPTHPATGYGYLQLGDSVKGQSASSGGRVVLNFKEKPDATTAQNYLAAGPSEYLWNSGMFVWKASVLMDCIKRYAPENHQGLLTIASAWDTPQRDDVAGQVYPTLKKISVDFAIMEPASRDDSVRVAALPMDLTWLDVGSWPSFGETCEKDSDANSVSAANCVHLDSKSVMVASNDPDHLVATLGCENLIIIHTPDATLVCPADRAEDIKQLYALVEKKIGKQIL